MVSLTSPKEQDHLHLLFLMIFRFIDHFYKSGNRIINMRATFTSVRITNALNPAIKVKINIGGRSRW